MSGKMSLICQKCQGQFSGKAQKNIICLSSAVVIKVDFVRRTVLIKLKCALDALNFYYIIRLIDNRFLLLDCYFFWKCVYILSNINYTLEIGVCKTLCPQLYVCTYKMPNTRIAMCACNTRCPQLLVPSKCQT